MIWRSNDDDRLVGDVDGLMFITSGPQGPRSQMGRRGQTDDRLVDDVDGLMLITGGSQGPRWIPGGQEGPDRRPTGG